MTLRLNLWTCFHLFSQTPQKPIIYFANRCLDYFTLKSMSFISQVEELAFCFRLTFCGHWEKQNLIALGTFDPGLHRDTNFFLRVVLEISPLIPSISKSMSVHFSSKISEPTATRLKTASVEKSFELSVYFICIRDKTFYISSCQADKAKWNSRGATIINIIK